MQERGRCGNAERTEFSRGEWQEVGGRPVQIGKALSIWNPSVVLIGTASLSFRCVSNAILFGRPHAILPPVDALLTSAASGLRSRTESLEMLANNLANATTAGYKADRESYNSYVSLEAYDGPSGNLLAVAPVIESNWIDYSQGPLVGTGNPLDLALSGEGFFAVEGPSGMRLTRNGAFLTDRDGMLVTPGGDKVLDSARKPIRLQAGEAVSVDADGTVRQGGQAVARLAVLAPERLVDLSKSGATAFHYQDAAGLRPASARVEQGRIEAANFSPAESTVRLVDVMRQFESLQRAIALGSEMNKRAIEEVAAVRE